jgi:hypothetical protein
MVGLANAHHRVMAENRPHVNLCERLVRAILGLSEEFYQASALVLSRCLAQI